MSLEPKRSDAVTQGYCIQAKRTKMLTLGAHKYLQDGFKKKERMLEKKREKGYHREFQKC